MKRRTSLGVSLSLALGIGGLALAQERGGLGEQQRDQQRQGQSIGGMSGKLDENKIKHVFQQKEYLKGVSITPRLEGQDTIVLEGNVPSKAHAVAAILACYEMPNVKHVNCKLNFQEGATGGAATMGGGQQIEVVAAIFPLQKAQATTLPAGVRQFQGLTDVIIFRPQQSSQGQQQQQTPRTPGSLERSGESR